MKSVWFEGGAAGMRLRADVAGDPSHPAVLLLHGGGQTRRAWRGTASLLGEIGHYVVSLDQRGHGESNWAADGDYGISAFVADLYAVLARLPSAPAIVGASLGGIVALTAIGEAAAPIARALALVDVTPRINPDGVMRILDFMLARPDGFGSPSEAADAIAAYLPHRKRVPNLAGLERNLRRTESGRYVWHWDPRFMDIGVDDMAAREVRFEAAARHVTIPTILVRGGLSDVVTADNARHFQALVPHASIVSIEGAAHMIAGDRNDAFGATIIEFLKADSAVGQLCGDAG